MKIFRKILEIVEKILGHLRTAVFSVNLTLAKLAAVPVLEDLVLQGAVELGAILVRILAGTAEPAVAAMALHAPLWLETVSMGMNSVKVPAFHCRQTNILVHCIHWAAFWIDLKAKIDLLLLQDGQQIPAAGSGGSGSKQSRAGQVGAWQET